MWVGMFRIAVSLLLSTVVGDFVFGQDVVRELTVHLVQACNDSPYAFVRAKFEPGEVSDPWAVRFFTQHGTEVPYFVWESVTWKVARDGRADWGQRFALLNHHPGDAPEARQMRRLRLEAAQRMAPELGVVLSARDVASQQFGDSICSALYLVRHQVPSLGKDKLALRIFPNRQIEPLQKRLEQDHVERRLVAKAGELLLHDLPDHISLSWKGKEFFRSAGFQIGDKSASKDGSITVNTHAEPDRPSIVEITEGIITKVTIRGQTTGRAESPMSWQCTYWLFCDGSYVGLQGFSFDNTEGYLGGGLSMATWELARLPQEIHAPVWEKPWWLFRIADNAYTAIHQFTDTPLTVGYSNNPFNASVPASFHVRVREKTKGAGDGLLELNWAYDLTDNRIYRLFHPRLDGDRSVDLAEVTDLRQTLLTDGKLTKVPTGAVAKDGQLIWPPERIRSIEEALTFVRWRPREDWLYRQYVVGVGDSATASEQSIRQVVGAAAGWVDRSYDEQELAELIVQFSLRKSSKLSPGSQSWVALPAVLNRVDSESALKILHECPDPREIAADAMQRIRKCIAGGGRPIDGTTKDGGEGWLHNPAYAGVDVPVSLRFMDHFGLFELAKYPRREYREALVEWADFSLEILGGKPLDWDQLRTSYQSAWSNRMVMLVPLLLRAYRETDDEKYARAAKLLFDEVFMDQVRKNPHGYFWAWGSSAQNAELFDLNYNVASYDRGLVDFWSEEQLPIIGRQTASQFVASQARYLAISGQLLDSLETDSMIAIQSQFPGGVPFAIGQVSPLLYDDFEFYRGLVGEAIRWSAIDDGATLERREGRRNLYSMKIGDRGLVFWAYGIGESAPRSKNARAMLERWKAPK